MGRRVPGFNGSRWCERRQGSFCCRVGAAGAALGRTSEGPAASVTGVLHCPLPPAVARGQAAKGCCGRACAEQREGRPLPSVSRFCAHGPCGQSAAARHCTEIEGHTDRAHQDTEESQSRLGPSQQSARPSHSQRPGVAPRSLWVGLPFSSPVRRACHALVPRPSCSRPHQDFRCDVDHPPSPSQRARPGRRTARDARSFSVWPVGLPHSALRPLSIQIAAFGSAVALHA